MEKLRPYVRALPDIFNYQIITKILLAVWIFLLGRIFQALLRSTGRIAVTSGDYMFLFNTWQGILILVIGLVSLFIYVAFDINAQIVISRDIVIGKTIVLKESMQEAFQAIRKLFCLRGVIVVLYIAFISPLLGFGLSISLTENLYIPTFISSVIESSVGYSLLAGVSVLVFLSVGIANLFIMHGIVIDDLSVKDASVQSGRLIHDNWKDYLKQNVLFVLVMLAVLALITLVVLVIPLYIIGLISLPPGISRFLTVLFVLGGVIVSLLADVIAIPVYMMKMTQLYYSYKAGEVFDYREEGSKIKSWDDMKKWAGIAAVIIIGASLIMCFNFDQLFPVNSSVKIIAHRAGGNEGSENTLTGLESAWKAGAYGSEIDVQRTRDGHYILNHDTTFKRVAGDKRKPEDMTLRQVKRLRINGEPVATFEEMLISSKGRIVLFTELKGNTADKKMADDVVELIKQFHMEDECVIISLKYDIIDYVESTYPNMQTGFLTFASLGKTAKLNCDYIALEEESATSDAISSIHQEGKKALVWTANKKDSQKHFLCSSVDGMITDNVSQAKSLSVEMTGRSDLERMVDKIKTII